MADEQNQPKTVEHQLSIQMDPQSANGVYANLLLITHRKEEFVLDFLFVQPQQGAQRQAIANLRSRVITSPAHAKRILRALTDNLRRYEDAFGTIEETADYPRVAH